MNEVEHVMELMWEYLPPHEFIKLRQVSSSMFARLKPIIERNHVFTFRIPLDEQMKTLSPVSLIVSSKLSICDSVTHLAITIFNKDHYNEILSSLPPSLLSLKLQHFNEPFNKLPSDLTYLITANEFNHPVHQLPPSLKFIGIGSYFTQPSVGTPIVLYYSNKPPTRPREHVRFWKHDYHKHFEAICLDQLPLTLKQLTLPTYYDTPLKGLPELTHLTLGDSFQKPLDNLPPSLTHLTLGILYNIPFNNLPTSITHLTLGAYFNQPLDFSLPALTHLTTGKIFNKSVDHLPQTLTHLTTGSRFNCSVDFLPGNLTHLTTGRCFNQPVDHLPQTLQSLVTGDQFNQTVLHLPQSLTLFLTGRCFNKLTDFLPQTTKHIGCTYWRMTYWCRVTRKPFHLWGGQKRIRVQDGWIAYSHVSKKAILENKRGSEFFHQTIAKNDIEPGATLKLYSHSTEWNVKVGESMYATI